MVDQVVMYLKTGDHVRANKTWAQHLNLILTSRRLREPDIEFQISKILTEVYPEMQTLQISSSTDIDNQIKELQGRLDSVRGDTQLINIDLKNKLQRQLQTLQTMSNVSKMLHETALSVIRKIG